MTKQLHVNLQEPLYRELAQFAIRNHRTISSVVRQQIRALISHESSSMKEIKNKKGEKHDADTQN